MRKNQVVVMLLCLSNYINSEAIIQFLFTVNVDLFHFS